MTDMDYGELFKQESGAVIFRSRRTDRFIPVEDMAQGRQGFIEQFFGGDVSVLYTPIESANKPRLMVHQVVRHSDLALRAYEISNSAERSSDEANWLRAEHELLPGS